MKVQKTALLSAYDKTGLENFASELVALGWNLLASAGTAAYLSQKGIEARDVSEIVGKPILGHRVVTLSREIHAALLATDTPEDQAELDRLGIPRIDLVYVNLYPLREEIAKPDCTLQSVIEKTDIGGPTLLRSAAKGRRITLCCSDHFPVALEFIRGAYTPEAEQGLLSALTCIAESEIMEYCKFSARYHRDFASQYLPFEKREG